MMVGINCCGGDSVNAGVILTRFAGFMLTHPDNLLRCCGRRRAIDAGSHLLPQPVTLSADVDDVCVMSEAVEHGRREHCVA